MAQDFEQYVNPAFKQLPDDIKSYSAFEMIPYLIKGIQELTAQNKLLQEKVEAITHGR